MLENLSFPTSSVCQSSAKICLESRDLAEPLGDESFPCELLVVSKSWLTLKYGCFKH